MTNNTGISAKLIWRNLLAPIIALLWLVTPSSLQAAGGSVVAWGRNDFNQAAAPPGLTNIVAVAVGLSHSLALSGNGTLVGWGTDGFGEINIPSGLTNVVAVAAGQYLSLALGSDGSVTGWGNTSVPAGLTNVSAISACSEYCLALKRDGTVVSWGRGWNGSSLLTLNPPADLTNVVAIAAGQAHGVALRGDGVVVAWGDNTFGQTNVPLTLTNVVALAAGQYRSLALNADGTLTTWGEAYTLPDETNAVAIASGAFHDLALMGDGNINGWGVDSYGVTDIPAGLTNAIAIAAGGWNSVALARYNFYFAARQLIHPTVYNGSTFYIQSAIANFPVSRYQWQFSGTNIPGATNGLLTLINVPLSGAGVYCVTVSNIYGLTISSNVILSVVTSPPFITSQPLPQTVVPGNSTAFYITADGSLPIYYQWQLNGTNIDGATNSVLSLTNLQLASQGYYDVVLSNAYGTVTSSNVFLHVLDTADALNATNFTWVSGGDVPWFVQTTNTHDGIVALQSGAIAAGQESIVQTTVTGPGTLTFWWNVSSEGGSNYLNISVNGMEQARISGIIIYGYYGWNQQTVYLGPGTQVLQWAYIKTDSGVSPSGLDSGWLDEVAFVPGSTPPFVTLNPTNQVVLWGSNATLNAAALGTPPLNYQWQLNQTNLDGATNASLVLTNLQFADEGNYTLVVSNAYGVTNANAAFLNVVDFNESLNATNLVWTSGGDRPWFPETSITHDGIAALQSGAIAGSQQSTVQTPVDGPGTLSFWWKVSSQTNNDYVNFSVDGLEQLRISGTVNWQQVIYSVAHGSHTLTWSYSKNATVNSGSDAAWLDQVSFVPGGTAPDITAQPANQMPPIGQTASFQVTALGTPPLDYQWQFGGTNIVGATNGTLTLAPWSSEGNYSVIVSNAYGVAVSSNATLTTPRTQIVPWGSNSSGQTNVPADLGNVLAIAAGGENSMALKSDGTVRVWGNNSYGQTNVPAGVSNAVAIACGGFYHCLALKGDGIVVGWGLNGFGKANVPAGLSNVVAIAAGDNHSLVLQNNGRIVAWGSSSSGQTNVPASLTNAIAIAAGSAHNLALRNNGTVAAWGDNGAGQTNVPAGLTNAVAIAASGNDSLALRSDGTVVAWGSNSSGQTNVPANLTNAVAIAAGSTFNLALRSDGTVVAWGSNGSGQTNVPAGLGKVVALAAGQSHSLALLNDGAPVVATQPLNQTTYAGMTAAFAANVLGLRPLAYQWQFNGTNIDGATNAALTLASVQTNSAGYYSLIASNVFGTITSSNATLTVLAVPPTLVLQPTNQMALLGSNVTFVVANGPGPIPVFYQWQYNGTNLDRATNASLVLTNVQFTNQGNYQVVVSNAFGAITSSNATLTVIDLAVALNAPELVWTNGGSAAWFAETSVTHDGVAAAQSGAIAKGQTSTLQTSVTGPGTLTFWWRFSQQNIIWDYLSFYVNSSQQASSSSTFDWQQKTFYLGSGTQTLQWTYSRSSIGPGILSTGWVDQVAFAPGGTPLIITQVPTNLFLMTRATASFVAAATGTPPIGYQWQFNGANLFRATNSSLTIANVQPSNSGNYTLTITNPCGSFVTNVTLFVQPFAFNTTSDNFMLTSSGLLMRVDGVLAPSALIIYASTNLTGWLPILTNPPATGSVQVLDSSTTNLPFRFYRAGEL
jgi:alpha-tubulin suppressor-like RCC1 family protein